MEFLGFGKLAPGVARALVPISLHLYLSFFGLGFGLEIGICQRCLSPGTPPLFPVFSKRRDPSSIFSTIPHPKQRRTDMSQNFNLFTTTSRGSGSSTGASLFNNNSNSFNTTNVSNHFTAPEDRSGILAWRSPLEPRVRHQNLEAGRVDKVGDWLLQTQQFRSWWDGSTQDESPNATIFCYGNPGAGKTYIW